MGELFLRKRMIGFTSDICNFSFSGLLALLFVKEQKQRSKDVSTKKKKMN
jgi:tRNA A37 threonylcarbamoyltransferase TsaD